MKSNLSEWKGWHIHSSATIGSRNAFNYAIRSYIHQKNSIDNFNDQDLEEIIASRNALREAEQKEIIRRNQTNSTKDDEVIQMKVNMFDIETALSYMLRGEIPRTKQIQGETYDALVNWLSMLAKVSCANGVFLKSHSNLCLVLSWSWTSDELSERSIIEDEGISQRFNWQTIPGISWL